MRTHPSWGEGSAVFTGLAEARRELGGFYVDVARRIAVGVDGVRIIRADFANAALRLELESFLAAAHLKQPWESAFSISARSNAAGVKLSIDGDLRQFPASRTLRMDVSPEGALRLAE